MNPLDLISLTRLMELGQGSSEIVIGLLDGPVAVDHPDLEAESIRGSVGCSQSTSAACQHGTFTAGILSAKRDSPAPAICPGCTLLVRPVFKETVAGNGTMPSVTSEDLAEATMESVDAGARVLNLSAAFALPSTKSERLLEEALGYAASLGVIVVVAAGNQGLLGSSAITRHPWVIPVAACDLRGIPAGHTNLGRSIGRRGLMAPGEGIVSLGTEVQPLVSGGTSVAAPFVTGTVALLWSLFPDAAATEVRAAVTGSYGRRQRTVTPPLLNAWTSYQPMSKVYSQRRVMR